MVKTSVIKRDSLEEKTIFELFYTNKCEEPFLQVEYPGIIYLKEGDHVNILSKGDTWESKLLLRQERISEDTSIFSPVEYIVKNSGKKGKVDMSLRIGGTENPLEKYYSLVRIKRGRY